MSIYPTYSNHLVRLARAYDRAVLAVRASNWHLFDLREYRSFYVEGDGSLPDWTRVRVGLLEEELPALAAAVNALIIAESKLWFEIPLPHGVCLSMPVEVERVLQRMLETEFHYAENATGDAVTKVSASLSENHLILFEGEGYLIPKSIPKSFIEIWWRRFWYDPRAESYYAMALVENSAYGWDCYGHER